MTRLGIVALLPAAGVLVWLQFWDRLLGAPAWLCATGIPAGLLLITVTTLVTSRKGARFTAKLLLATVTAPFRDPPPVRGILASLVAATGEELIFRLLGLWLLGEGVLGISATTLAFALAHLPTAKSGRRLVTFIDAALCGALLAGLFLATGGIAAPALAHFIRNLSLDSLRLGHRRAKDRESKGESS